MFGERMGVPFLWTDVRLLYLPVSSFFDLVCSQSCSCVTCSELRQRCVLAGDVEGSVRRNDVENGYDTVKSSECGNDTDCAEYDKTRVRLCRRGGQNRRDKEGAGSDEEQDEEENGIQASHEAIDEVVE